MTFRRTPRASSRALARRTVCTGTRAVRRTEGPWHHLLTALSHGPAPRGAHGQGVWGTGRHPASFTHSGSQTCLHFGITRDGFKYADACLGPTP